MIKTKAEENKDKPTDQDKAKKCGQGFKFLNIDGTKYKTKVTTMFNKRKPYVPHNPYQLHSFIPGTVQKLYVKEGDKVKIGTKVMILDAMKMRNEIRSPIEGIVKRLNVKIGEQVPNKHLLIEFAPS